MYNSKENSRVIEERLIRLGDATTVNGRIFRGLYSKEDMIGKKLIKQWIKEDGLEAYEDSVGNVFGRVKGKIDNVILVGSHIDTVKDGGRYDGALGVVAATTCIAQLYKTNGQPYNTIEVVGLIGEEGSRYPEGYIGSKAITGMLKTHILNSRDTLDIKLATAMEEAGYNPKKITDAIRDDIKAYIELHIEQGPHLENKGASIGIVKNIVGLAVFEIKISGRQNHAGTTPMDLRLDPVVAASRVILSVTEKIQRNSDTAVLTIGDINAIPGMSNVIAKEVNFTIDFRDGDRKLYQKGKEAIVEIINVLRNEGFGVEIRKPFDEPPTALDEKLMDLAYKIALEQDINTMLLNSGAGHDAQVFAHKVPACMIFVPSKSGISHSKEEYTSIIDIRRGFNVLSGLLEHLAWGKE
jgi:allantoate deiminase